MKHAADAILRPEQAAYLDALHAKSVSFARDELLRKMEARAAEKRFPISDPEVACLLAIVARIARPALVVELGTNIGYGAIVLARAAGPGARVVTIERRADLCDEARANVAAAGLSDRVEVRQGTAIEALETIAEPIDLLYVDCVKEEYPRYLEIAVPKLSERAVVVADNTLWQGLVAQSAAPDSEKARVEALRAFNLSLVSRADLCGVVLPLGDGVGLAVRV